MSAPMIGHRSSNFQDYTARFSRSSRTTDRPTGVSQHLIGLGHYGGAIQNLVQRKLLCCMCGRILR